MSEQPMWKAGDRVCLLSGVRYTGTVTRWIGAGCCKVKWDHNGIELDARGDDLMPAEGTDAKPPVDDDRVWAVMWSTEPARFITDATGTAAWLTRAEAEAICAKPSSYRRVVVRHPACPEPEPTAKRPFKVGDRVRVNAKSLVAECYGQIGTVAGVGDGFIVAVMDSLRDIDRSNLFAYHQDYVDHIDAESAQPAPAPTEPPAPTQPAPRCGQTWEILPAKHGQGDTRICERGGVASHRIHRGGQAFDIYDRIDDTFRIRLDDGIRTELPAYVFGEVGMVRFISGPTTPETPREELERVVKLEAATPPEGVTPREWLATLIGWAEGPPQRGCAMTDAHWRAMVLRVRSRAAMARAGSPDAPVQRLSVDGYGRVRR